MKRTLSIIAALLAIMSVMTFAVGAAVGEVESGYTPAEGSVGISSLSEITDTAGTYHLTGDITVSETYAEAFSGVLDGCGHTVTVSAPMFAEFNGTIKNMVLDGSITTTDSSAAAVAVTSTSSMTAMNITSNVDITVSGTAADLYAAAIVSVSTSTDVVDTFEAIVNNGDITVNAPEGSKPRAAGIAARINNAVFSDCLNNGTVYASGSQVVVGGICARGSNTGKAVETDFYHCINNGNVSGDGLNAYAGGICGYNGRSSNEGVHNFVGCVNTGNISADYRSAGIVAYVYGSKTQNGYIENCINTGTITFGGNIGTDGTPTDVCGSPFVAYTNSANTVIKNNIDIGSLVSVEEGYASYSFIACSSVNYTENLFSDNYVTDVATKFNYLAYSATEENRIAIDQAGAALTDTTIDYIKSEEFTNAVSGFIKTDSLPVTQSGDSWNGTEYVMYVAEHVCGDLIKVEAVASTCGTAGNIEYYKCACGKCYSDSEAKTEITDRASVELPLDPAAHVTVYGSVSDITFTGAYNNVETFTLPITCKYCDWTDSVTIVAKEGENYTNKANIVANCQYTEGIRYYKLDFGTGKTYTFTAYNPDGATDPTRHTSPFDYKDNGDCSHTIIYGCCENATKITYHNYSSGVCRQCEASQEERDLMHKWEVSYEWQLDDTGLPYGCRAVRTCSVCNRTNKTAYINANSTETQAANCQQGGKIEYTVTFEIEWAENQTKTVDTPINPDNHAKTTTNAKNNGDGTHSAVYECCNKTVEAEAHILVQGETGFEGKWHDATALTLVVSCKTCDYSEVLKSTVFSLWGGMDATCKEPSHALYRNVDFGNGIIINVTAVDPSGELDPNNHVGYVGTKDNGDCSHTVIFDCCENASVIEQHWYGNGVCGSCGALQEERDSMHKWSETEYTWSYNATTGLPYRCQASRVCSACNRQESNSVNLQMRNNPVANCQQTGIRTYTAKFTVEWAKEQTKAVTIDINPDNHVSRYVWYINSDGTHSRKYTCCGALTDTTAHTYDETTKKCTSCGYTEGATLYTVTFIADGKVICTTNACVGSRVRTPSAPDKEGYTFNYWYTEENGKGNAFTSTYNTEGDTTYYAYYKNKFDVSFSIIVNNRNYTIETLKDVPYGTLVSAPASEKYASRIPVGYYFDGWYTGTNYKTAFDFENTKIVNDKWIYGKLTECTEHIWGEVAYDLSDDLTSCTATRTCTRCLYSETATSVSANVTLVEAATCAKVGIATGTATFDVEWAADQSGNIELAIDPDNHVNPSVTYKWENDEAGIPYKCTATLSCDACGYMETVSVKDTWFSYKSRPTCQAEGVAFKIAEFGSKYPWAENQNSEEYVVAKDPNRHISSAYSIKDDTYHTRKYICCGMEEDYEHDMKDDVCLFCGYKKGAAIYVVTFVVDGKELGKINVCYGSSVSRPNAPAKDGYVFQNWYTEENGQGNAFNFTYNTEGDTTYYAYYTNKVQYRFRIVNPEGKQQTIISYTEVLYGTTVSAPTFSEYADKIPEGYYIEGWYTDTSFNTEFDFSQPLTKLNTSIYGKLAELKGWCEIDGEWYYYYEDGTKATGFARVPYNTELGHAPNADDLAYYNANTDTSKYSDSENAVYYFAEDGKLIRENGIVDDKGTVRYAVDGVIAWHVGMVEVEGEYYYFGGDVNGGGNVMLTGNVYATRNTTELDMVVSGIYTFAEDGKMCKYEGLTEVDGALYYYDGYCRSKSVGVVKTADGYIYVRTTNHEVITGKQYWVSMTGESGVIKGSYVIDDNGFIKDPVLVNTEATTGIFDGYYYVDGEVQYAAGAIEIDGDIYYVRANGQIVAGGEYWVTQSSELLPAGKYTFDENGKLIK